MSKILPSQPNPELLRKQAKELKKAIAGQHADALARVRSYHPRFAQIETAVAAGALALQDAQLVLAREYGYSSWPKSRRDSRIY